MESKTTKIIIQLLAIVIILYGSYFLLETALTFFLGVILIAFFFWRNRIHKSNNKK